MSNYNVWTVSNAIYEEARALAKQRVQTQWNNWMNNPQSLYLWRTFNTVQNTTWFDPWFENELGGFYNGPGVTASPDSYEVTQNAYFIYNWMKYKGYNDYCIMVMLVVCWNECRMGMGAWEGQLCPWNFRNTTNPSALIGFTPNRTGESGTNYNNDWHQNGSIVPGSYTSSVMDEVTHITYQLYRQPGSWEAYRRWEIDTYTDPETGLERVRLVNGEPQYYIPEGEILAAIGYGLVQWTNWTRLVNHAGRCFPNYGAYHWQFNATLQLYTLEWERKTAMETDHTQQYGSGYQGEWVDDNATRAYFVYNGTEYHYPSRCTWDNWAAGGHLTWVENRCAQLGITNQTTIENYKQLITFDILGRCYLHSSHYNTNFSTLATQRNYFKGAIAYWDSHGGWDVKDIPRLRDRETTDLDPYHMSKGTLVSVLLTPQKRGKKSCQLHIHSTI